MRAQDGGNNLFKKNSYYFEIFGNGGLYSINYDRVLVNKSTHKLTARLGLAVYPEIFGSGSNGLVLPSELNLLFGRKNKFFEAGLGASAGFSDNHNDRLAIFGLIRLGYRSINAKNFLFRAGITPIYWIQKVYDDPPWEKKEFRIYPWAGFSFGKVF